MHLDTLDVTGSELTKFEIISMNSLFVSFVICFLESNVLVGKRKAEIHLKLHQEMHVI